MQILNDFKKCVFCFKIKNISKKTNFNLHTKLLETSSKKILVFNVRHCGAFATCAYTCVGLQQNTAQSSEAGQPGAAFM